MTDTFLPLINTVASMFIMLVVGFIGGKANIIDEDASKKISEIVIKIAQPFMIAGAVLSMEKREDSLGSGIKIILFAFLCYFILSILALLFTFKIKDNYERRVSEYSLIFTNGAFLGFPILKSVFPENGLFWGAFYVIVYNIVVWTYGIFVLKKANNSIKLNIKNIFFNYGTVPCIIALIIFATGINLPDFVTAPMNYIGSVCTPISMLVIGALISRMNFKDFFCDIKIYYFSVIKLFIIPIIISVIFTLFGLEKDIVLFMCIMNCLATSASTTMFCETYNTAPLYAAKCVGLSTLLCVFITPLVLLITDSLFNLLRG